jgi:hypothetical protein
MQTKEKLAIWASLLAGPATAYAAEGAPGGTVLFAFGGGLVGGFLGALLACWLCNKRRAPTVETGPKKY